jgi:hypothetical protein
MTAVRQSIALCRGRGLFVLISSALVCCLAAACATAGLVPPCLQFKGKWAREVEN